MHQYCHRCGGQLAPGDEITSFCPHCGAPQLYLQEYDEPAPAVESHSTAAPQLQHLQLIDWRTAIGCAAIVAATAALLAALGLGLPTFSFLSTFWILSGSVITLALYQRRRPLARMDARVGARIGLTTGLALVASLTVTVAVAGIIARFVLHSSSGFDAQMAQILQQMTVQLSRTAAGNPELPAILAFVASPEFRAGYALFSVATVALILLFLSTLSGAFSGLLRSRRPVTP